MDVLNALYITEEDIINIKTAVKDLLTKINEYENVTIETLQKNIRRLNERLNKLYIDKIDGDIDDDFYFETRSKWQSGIDESEIKLNSIIKFNKYFIDDVERMLELCKNASLLYLRETDEEK